MREDGNSIDVTSEQSTNVLAPIFVIPSSNTIDVTLVSKSPIVYWVHDGASAFNPLSQSSISPFPEISRVPSSDKFHDTGPHAPLFSGETALTGI